MKQRIKKVIVLTGPSGSGKSSVARVLARRGYRWIKADEVARGLYEPGKPANAKIRKGFGSEYLDPKGRVDRQRLGALVFSKPAALKKLNAILFPALIRELRAMLAKSKAKACVDMAVYFEAGAPNFHATLCLVDAPLSVRIKRLEGRGLDLKRARMQARALKFGPAQRRAADLVLTNSGSLAELKPKLKLFF